MAFSTSNATELWLQQHIHTVVAQSSRCITMSAAFVLTFTGQDRRIASHQSTQWLTQPHSSSDSRAQTADSGRLIFSRKWQRWNSCRYFRLWWLFSACAVKVCPLPQGRQTEVPEFDKVPWERKSGSHALVPGSVCLRPEVGQTARNTVQVLVIPTYDVWHLRGKGNCGLSRNFRVTPIVHLVSSPILLPWN